MGKPLPQKFVLSQYRIVLNKLECGELKTPVRTLLKTIMRDRHVFRGGTSVEDDAGRREYYTDLIATCQKERDILTPIKKRKKSVAKIDLIGRRVVMQADVFGGSENEVYNGLVVRKGRYTQRDKVKHGYVVKWHDGDEDMW